MDQFLSFAMTADGSKTLFNSRVGEHYHSRHGAVQESKHVFLESGLRYFLGSGSNKASVLEMGFGTGLNFLMTAAYCSANNIELRYTGIEAYPLDLKTIAATDYEQYVTADLWQEFINQYENTLQRETSLGAAGRLFISCRDLLSFETTERFDVIYFDAFAAVHQPEMWNTDSLTHISKFLRPGGVFVTYAITGNLKRTMKSLGFSVEKAPGAPGKREMLRAVKL